VNEFLGLQGTHLQLLCGLVLGYPAHEPPKPPRQLEGRIKWIS